MVSGPPKAHMAFTYLVVLGDGSRRLVHAATFLGRCGEVSHCLAFLGVRTGPLLSLILI